MPGPIDPTLPRYHNWNDVPDGLVARAKLRAEGLKLKPDAAPVARYSSMFGACALYRRADTVPLKTRKVAR